MRFDGQIRQVTTPLLPEDLAPLPDYSLDGIRHLSPDLEDLLIGWTRSKRFSLTTLARFTNLRTLYLEGQQKDIEAIGALEGLEDLTLRSITLPNLSALEPLRNLRSIDIKLGGTKDLRLLPQFGRLESVELWMVRGLEDVSPLADVHRLDKLFLQSLTRVSRLPSFAASPALRHVVLQTMKGISDLRPLARAPNLKILTLVDMRHLGPDDLRPFLHHPKLRDGRWGFGSDRKNAEAWDLLPLGPKPFNYDVYKARSARRVARTD